MVDKGGTNILKCYCLVGETVINTDMMGSRGFACGTVTPETRWAKQEEEQSQHHPSHHNHGKRQVIFPANQTTGTRY